MNICSALLACGQNEMQTLQYVQKHCEHVPWMCVFLEEEAFLCSTHCCAAFTTAPSTKPSAAQEPDFGLMG